MSSGRKYKSGGEKKRLKKEQDDNVKKTHAHLASYFQAPTGAAAAPHAEPEPAEEAPVPDVADQAFDIPPRPLSPDDEPMLDLDADPGEGPAPAEPGPERRADAVALEVEPGPEYATDLAAWPSPFPDGARDFWAERGAESCQHMDADFEVTAKLYTGEKYRRQCSEKLFSFIHEPSKQATRRSWLCYSPSSRALFCFPCKLMGKTGPCMSYGLDDWKNAQNLLRRHESGKSHIDAVTGLLARKLAGMRVDAGLVAQMDAERSYWRNLLTRVTEVIRFICERGLALRGDDEIIGSPHNGNFLGIIELLAKFDPFIDEHLKRHGNKGRGHPSYLSSTIVEEFVKLMGKRVQAQIVKEIKDSKYFSVSVDSTPDVAHIDQLTCIVRYVTHEGPIERFLTFLEMHGHTGAGMAKSLLDFLAEEDINIQDCRGQSYDNASNMSGRVNGMQAHILEQCLYAVFVPCFAHTLNLIGQAAADCCQQATVFFCFLQALYVFATGSTHRFELLMDILKPLNLLTVKRAEGTRWAEKADAVRALVEGYQAILQFLVDFAENPEERADQRQEARGLAATMGKLETGILAVMWNRILGRFNVCSQKLQSSKLDLNAAVSIYESLLVLLDEQRNEFDAIEVEAKALCQVDAYELEQRRPPKRSRRYDEVGAEPEQPMTPRDRFRTGTFLVIIDKLKMELQRRLAAYREIHGRFGILRKLFDATSEELQQAATNLVQSYPIDLEQGSVLFDEFIQLRGVWGMEDLLDPDGDESIELRLYKTLRATGLDVVFPNVTIVLKIYLCMMVTNCTGERSFSSLKRVKCRDRSSMTQLRLNALVLMTIEYDVLRKMDLSDLIDEFSLKKSRKKPVK